jgi:hypothetical protein
MLQELIHARPGERGARVDEKHGEATVPVTISASFSA